MCKRAGTHVVHVQSSLRRRKRCEIIDSTIKTAMRDSRRKILDWQVRMEGLAMDEIRSQRSVSMMLITDEELVA